MLLFGWLLTDAIITDAAADAALAGNNERRAVRMFSTTSYPVSQADLRT